MPAAECNSRNERQKERRAKAARRAFARYGPRPQLLRDFTKETGEIKNKTLWGDLLAAPRGSMTDAFFGASPVVASALGIRSGATPRGRLQPSTPLPADPSKQDISTLLGIGHFYFALTGGYVCCDVFTVLCFGEFGDVWLKPRAPSRVQAAPRWNSRSES